MRVVILGAGFGGLELATRLSASVAEQVDVTVIDKSGAFIFGFTKLDVMFGRCELSQAWHSYEQLRKPSVTFRQETVTAIDGANRRVTTNVGIYDADVLVVALGADYDVDATPGLAEGGFEFYTPAGADRARQALERFEGGTVVIGVLGQFFKCPGAPNEAALLVSTYLSQRGLRERSSIHLVSPLSKPIPISERTSRSIISVLEEHDILYSPSTQVLSLDPHTRVAHLSDGRELAYDLFLGIPVHCAPQVVADSDLVENGWIPVDPATFATKFEGVYAVGDVTSAPVPRAGGIAEGEAASLADALIAQVRGSAAPPPYDGAAACYVELGDGMAGRIDVNFLAYDTPVARFNGPNTALLEDKRLWGEERVARWFGAPDHPA
jgi:sulfide:quinone oxidoreductase